MKQQEFFDTAVVVFSGGQDSTSLIGYALNQGYDNVYAISFAYGQKHSIELECAAEICKQYGIDHKIIDISFFGSLVRSALTNENEDVNEKHPDNENLPASFVPNRNATFLTLTHAYAQTVKAKIIYAGMCQTDYSGYPDCREKFIRDMAIALNGGADISIYIATPLMHLTKAQIFALAEKNDFLDEVIELSHTCYNGDHKNLHDWGYGCDNCPACKLRKKGYDEFCSGKEC